MTPAHSPRVEAAWPTALGGPHAGLAISVSIPHLVTTIDAQGGRAGLQYLDYRARRAARGSESR